MAKLKYFEGDTSFIGKNFGSLRIISAITRIKGEPYVKASCVCKAEKLVRLTEIQRGKAVSCGCMNNLRHGHKRRGKTSRVYQIWSGIIKRCSNTKGEKYPNYAGRGIKVCDRWLKFENFLEDMGKPEEDESIDRIDNNGNYEPSNCRWATKTTQMRNFRRNKLVEYNGEVHCLSEWEEILGMNPGIIGYRLAHGWPIDKAFTAPIRKMRSNKII